jgi:hypothetical protein
MNKEAMKHLVRAHRIAMDIDKIFRSLGYSETPYDDIAGYVADGIYFLLGEHTDTFDKSVTFSVLNNKEKTEEEKCASLLCEYVQNNGVQKLKLNDHVKEALKDAAEKRGVDVDAMISIILSEWVMRQAWISSLVGA